MSKSVNKLLERLGMSVERGAKQLKKRYHGTFTISA